jgi:PAS domain-containing protein
MVGRSSEQNSVQAPRLIASWTDNSRELTVDRDFVGGKAAGLLQLPQGWVPPFVVLTKEFCKSVSHRGSIVNALAALPNTEQKLLDELRSRVEQSGEKILVRSNAPDETLANRGAYRSYPVPFSLDAIAEAVSAIFDSARANMYIILQSAIEPGQQGHMSNERRVTSKPGRWLLEGLFGEDLEPHQRFILAGRDEATNGPLLAGNERELLERLRAVASALRRIGAGHHHCEWVWDGRRLWIVQCDEAPAEPMSSDARWANDYLLSAEPIRDAEPPHSPFVPFDQTSDIWSKLDCPKLFKALGLPTAGVYHISGTDWVASDATDRIKILDELARMCERPTVVRCDVTKAVQIEELLLPTSKASSDSKELVKFMDEQAREFSAKGLRPEWWGFLLAVLRAGCGNLHRPISGVSA